MLNLKKQIKTRRTNKLSKDYYSILGIEKGASDSEIKSAFRTKARKFHPDVNKNPEAQSIFTELNEAYQVLSDPQKRQRYDQYGSSEGFDFNQGGAGGFGDFSDIFGESFGGFGDIFENFFGGSQQGGGSSSRGGTSRKSRGEDLQMEIAITLDEASKGIEKEISIRHLQSCPKCKGTGSNDGKGPKTCSTCGGRGEVRQTRQTMFGTMSTVTACPACRGAGQVLDSPCSHCSGTGRFAKSKKLKINIPSGVDIGAKLRIAGEGNVGQQQGSAGDLYVIINIKKHPKFKREGAHIHSSEKISFAQAALGNEILVETIQGKVTLKIVAGTQTHTIMRIRGKGMPYLQRGGNGDHYVQLIIETPRNLSGDDKTIMEYFAYLRKEKIASLKDSNLLKRIKKIIK